MPPRKPHVVEKKCSRQEQRRGFDLSLEKAFSIHLDRTRPNELDSEARPARLKNAIQVKAFSILLSCIPLFRRGMLPPGASFRFDQVPCHRSPVRTCATVRCNSISALRIDLRQSLGSPTYHKSRNICAKMQKKSKRLKVHQNSNAQFAGVKICTLVASLLQYVQETTF